MKIAVVYHYFAHYRKSVINELIIESERRGDELIFLADKISNEPNIKLYKFDGHEDKLCLVKNIWLKKFLWQRGLIQALSKHAPDTIIFLGQFNFISTWIASIIFKLLGKQIIFWGHGVYGSEKGLKKIVRNRFNSLPHAYMTYGEHAKLLMEKTKVKSVVSVIYNSLDVKKQNENYFRITSQKNSAMELYDFDNAKTNLIFIGRLTKIKKIHLILEAINNIDVANYNLLIIGAGPEEDNLKKYVEKLKLNDKVTFKGPIHDEERLSWMIYNSDLCISPGNVGLTAMHALIYGTPVITNNDFAHQMPEFEAIQDNINGGFFEVDNVHSLAEKIIFWRDKIIREGRQNIRDICREPILKYYNPENQARLILAQVHRNASKNKK